MTVRIKSNQEYLRFYEQSIKDPEGFWADQASTFHWMEPWSKVLDWEFKTPDVKWFIDGKLNITENCLDRHLETKGDQIAYYWEPNHPDSEAKTWTYNELHAKVCQAAHMLSNNGIVPRRNVNGSTIRVPQSSTIGRSRPKSWAHAIASS